MDVKCTLRRQKQWRKILYEDQEVEDNYVHATFLHEMEKNIFVRTYDYWTLARSSVILTQQLCAVSIFFLSWWYMGNGTITPQLVLMVSVITSGFGYAIYLQIHKFPIDSAQARLVNDLKTALMLLSFTAFLSPILKTLTHTISTDTVYAMATLMLIGHFLFHDYYANTEFASRSVSLNMSVFAAVCLASRLETTLHTFATVILALQLFGLWPILRCDLWKNKPCWLHILTVTITIVVFLSMLLISILAGALFFTVSLLVSFAFPAILISLQSHKNNIHGPWDEAVINDNN